MCGGTEVSPGGFSGDCISKGVNEKGWVGEMVGKGGVRRRNCRWKERGKALPGDVPSGCAGRR